MYMYVYEVRYWCFVDVCLLVLTKCISVSTQCMCMYICFIYLPQTWSKLQTSGRKPPARLDHSTCVITGDHQLVIGGLGRQEVLSDVWLLDLTNGSWSEVLHVYVQYHRVCLVMCAS